MELTALEDIPLSTKTVLKGDDFEVEDKIAKVLLAIGKAKRKTLHVRNTYRRRDMRPEE